MASRHLPAPPSLPSGCAWESRARELLRQHWGHSELRPSQREAIQAALSSRDSLVILATGCGKSLCYQLVPLLTAKPAIVVSPLISLMTDQVRPLTILVLFTMQRSPLPKHLRCHEVRWQGLLCEEYEQYSWGARSRTRRPKRVLSLGSIL